MNELDNRIPPQAIDVERTVLGAMLVSAESVAMALELLNDGCFYLTANRHIFNCMAEMFENSTPIDVVTLASALKKKGIFEVIGEETYLGELAESIATSGNIEYYSEILLEKSTLRDLLEVSGSIDQMCFKHDIDSKEALEEVERSVFNISESRVKNKAESFGQLLPNTFQEIEGYYKGNTGGVKTGFTELDELTTGFQNGDLIIVAGRPSMGKTALCLSMATHAAIKCGIPVAVFSLEMSKSQLMQRVLCSEARVNMHQLRSGTLPKREFPRLSLVAGPIAEAPVYIDDTPGASVLELRSKARRMKRQQKIGLIIIDYLQLMSGDKKQENRQQEITHISRSLKAVAKELNIPVIALSQLSRAVESRTSNHRPQLSDLRESGAIEQDADVVLFVYRDEVYDKKTEEGGVAEIIIGKQRNGPLGTAKVAFVKEFARFENLAKNIDAEQVSWTNDF